MKKFLSLILLLLNATTFAGNTGGVNVLKEITDSLHLKLTVDWDQQDQDFYNQAINDFTAELNELQKNGLSNTEILQFAKSQIQNEQLAQDFDQILSTVKTEKLDVLQTRDLVLKALEGSQSTGASWYGRGYDLFLGSVIVIFVLAAAGGAYYYGGGYYYYPYPDCYYDWYWNDYICYYW